MNSRVIKRYDLRFSVSFLFGVQIKYTQCCIQEVTYGSRTRTRTFLDDNNTGLQWTMAYLLTYIRK